MITLFTSYKAPVEDEIVQEILSSWKLKNPTVNVLYFSDQDVDSFFEKDAPQYFDYYTKMKNGVSKADFFRINYIQKYGGYWFDIDLEPITLPFQDTPFIHLFDAGYGNISYMFIGGQSNQKLFQDVIETVYENIKKNIPQKKDHVINITGPRVIQNIVFEKLNIPNKDFTFPGKTGPQQVLQNTEYEFTYQKLEFKSFKTLRYKQLLQKYQQKKYQMYNYI
jgi:mannosyltransferase OCH1-like enzyme